MTRHPASDPSIPEGEVSTMSETPQHDTPPTDTPPTDTPPGDESQRAGLFDPLWLARAQDRDRRCRHAKQALTNLIIREVREELGPEGVPSAPDPGYLQYGNQPQPDPLTAIRIALVARQQANVILDAHIARARGAGHSWDVLAEALELTQVADEAGIPHGEAAFNWAAARRIDGDTGPRWCGHDLQVWWRCGTCEQRITDHGPFNGQHPDEEETGHAPDCPRHTAELAAWRTRHGWDDDQDADDGQDDDQDADGDDGVGDGDA
jgi:hypothetical protein